MAFPVLFKLPMNMERINNPGLQLGDIMVHQPTRTIGVVVGEEEQRVRKSQHDTSFRLRTEQATEPTFVLSELREATAEEKAQFHRETRDKAGFGFVNYVPGSQNTGT
jgi:hypothetical protein